MPRGQRQWLAADNRAKLTEGDDRTRKSNRADKDADENLDFVNRFFGGSRKCLMLQVTSDADQDRRRTHKTMEDGDELGHRGHCHARRQNRADDHAGNNHGN